MTNQEDLQVITKSKALVKHTFVITSNLTRYPKKYRVTFLDDVAKYYLQLYLNERIDCNDALFVSNSKNHKRLKESGIQYIMKRIHGNSELGDRRVYPHLLRKTLATTMNQKNCQPQIIQQILGHESINTTLRYYAATSTEQLRMAHRAYA